MRTQKLWICFTKSLLHLFIISKCRDLLRRPSGFAGQGGGASGLDYNGASDWAGQLRSAGGSGLGADGSNKGQDRLGPVPHGQNKWVDKWLNNNTDVVITIPSNIRKYKTGNILNYSRFHLFFILLYGPNFSKIYLFFSQIWPIVWRGNLRIPHEIFGFWRPVGFWRQQTWQNFAHLCQKRLHKASLRNFLHRRKWIHRLGTNCK